MLLPSVEPYQERGWAKVLAMERDWAKASVRGLVMASVMDLVMETDSVMDSVMGLVKASVMDLVRN